ncbi:MAG: thioredoxin family protein [Bacteroidales bacterium]|nr:thioredoxin family protein [Bacteroidales bacterium]
MKFRIFILMWILATLLPAQIVEPVKWSVSQKKIGEDQLELSFTAKIDKGWHLYSNVLPEGGPIATTVEYELLEGVQLEGAIKPNVAPVESYSPLFELVLGWFKNEVKFTQRVKLITPDDYKISGAVRYMACNDETCLPPTNYNFNFFAEVLPEVKQANFNSSSSIYNPASWQPVIEELKAFEGTTTQNSSLLYIFIAGFIGGLLALLTPCVWPMMPMTVSFFIKHSGSRKKAIKNAFLYGLAIIIIYVALGLVITTIFGASALNNLSTNAWFNIFFFLLLLLFAASFFGAFELTLPASWTTKLDAKADATTGFISILLMAFTLALVSFSCTGPIIGTLLVEAASSGVTIGPAVGMFAFALALAIPFALFAIFPTIIKSLPRSGGWLNTIKVVLAFIELALALKFLSVADLAYGWGILPRETFLTLWIVIFFLLGLYLLGVIQFKHDIKPKYLSVTRLFLAIIPLAFSIYMIPGLWGAPLKAISAFAPPMSTQYFDLYSGEEGVMFDDFDEALKYSKQHNKPLFIDFTGYGCVNCRKMEASVFTDTGVKDILDNEYVFVTLTVDDKTPLAEPIRVKEYGKNVTLKTVGDKWSYLQRYKFGANAQPYYLLLSPDGKPLTSPYSYNENIADFKKFLRKGLENNR